MTADAYALFGGRVDPDQDRGCTALQILKGLPVGLGGVGGVDHRSHLPRPLHILRHGTQGNRERMFIARAVKRLDRDSIGCGLDEAFIKISPF